MMLRSRRSCWLGPTLVASLLRNCRLGRIHPFRVRSRRQRRRTCASTLAIHAAIDEAIIAWRRESPFSMAGTGSGSSSLARFTGSVAPLLRFCFPRQRSLAASRDVREMPAPACVPLRRWPVSRSRFPGSHRARASSMRFSAFEIRRVQSGVWRHVKCFPFGSTLLIMRAPSPQGRRSKRRGVTVMSADATIARDSADLPRRTASIGSSSVCGSCAAGPFCDAAFRYPQLLRTARPGRTSAADCSASSPHSAALMGFKCPFAVLSLSQGVFAFPRC